MTNGTGRNYDSQPKNNDTADYKKTPTHESGQHLPNQQDPSKKNQANDPRSRDGQDSEQVERRRA